MAKYKKVKKTEKRFAVKGIVFGIALIMIIGSVMEQPKILHNKKVIASLEEQIDYEKEKANQLDELKEKVGTDEYIEKIARDKLGLVKENEKIFIDVTSQ